jgi:MoxR-like ATPase
VLATGAIALGTAILNHRWQRSDTREDRTLEAREARAAIRRDAYVRYFATKEALESYLKTRAQEPGLSPLDKLRAMHQDNPGLVNEFNAAAANARLVAGQPVLDALEANDAEWGAVLGRLVQAADPLEVQDTSSDGPERALLQAMREEQAAVFESS